MTPAPVVDALDDCTLSSSEPGEPIPTTLPTMLTNANWSVKADACEQAGFDLTTCAGEMATLYPFQQTVEKNPGHPTTGWVIAVGDTICCVYLADDSNPGIYPAECD